MGRLGRDRSFYRHVGDTDHFPEEVKARFEYGISHSRNFENPYLSYILRGNYSESSLPDYLRERVFASAQANVINADPADHEAYNRFLARYRRALPVVQAAADNS